MSGAPKKLTAAEIQARLTEDTRLLQEAEREEEEERRRQEEERCRQEEEAAEAKRKADEEAERKRKADEAAEKKRKAENVWYQQLAAQQQEEFEKDKADKVERARKREEEKQKRQKEGTARQTRKGTMATMGLGAQEAEGSGVGKKRKQVPDDDGVVSDSEIAGSIEFSITTNNGIDDGPTCGKCAEGRHKCEQKGNGACFRCIRLHLKCEWPGMTGKGKGKEKGPQVGVTKKMLGESDVGIRAVVAAISMGFVEMTVMLKQQRDYMAGALGEIGESRRHIMQELERAWEEMEIMWCEARRASDNMYAMALDLSNQLTHFWDLCPVYVERVTRLAEVHEEHGEGGQECKGEETGDVGEKTGDDEEFAGEATGNVREQTGDDEGNAGDGENGADEESKVSQTRRTQK
jgi:hypothetical protein